jgi:hypothetical protein
MRASLLCLTRSHDIFRVSSTPLTGGEITQSAMHHRRCTIGILISTLSYMP